MKYWDLENFSSITQTKGDTSSVTHLSFSELNAEHIFAVSQENMKVWNIETNKLLDSLAVPPKPVADFGITY